MTKPSTGAPAPRRFGAPKNWRDTFLTALGETSNVAAAARAAQISVSWVYKTRREDREFKRRWFAALCEGYDNLEMEVLYRLRSGRLEETDEDGTRRKFDVAASIRMLMTHRESVGRERARQSHRDEAAILASINAKIDRMRAREKEFARMQAGADDQG